MTLDEWLKIQGLRPAHFADIVGINPCILYNAKAGRKRIGKEVARLIEQETGGDVTMKEAIWPEDYPTKQECK